MVQIKPNNRGGVRRIKGTVFKVNVPPAVIAKKTMRKHNTKGKA
jgi:hypothetical protein